MTKQAPVGIWTTSTAWRVAFPHFAGRIAGLVGERSVERTVQGAPDGGAQPLIPTAMTNVPTTMVMVALTAVECRAIQALVERRRGSIHSGARIVATMGTTAVLVASAV